MTQCSGYYPAIASVYLQLHHHERFLLNSPKYCDVSSGSTCISCNVLHRVDLLDGAAPWRIRSHRFLCSRGEAEWKYAVEA